MNALSRLQAKTLLQPAACLLALLALGTGMVAWGQQGLSASDGAPDAASATALDPAAIAGRLPPLPAEDGAVELPLAGDGPWPWVAIDGGPGVDHPKGELRASYAVAPGRPAGAALIFRPGTLAGLEAIEIEIRGNRSTRLVPTLRDVDGVVYRLPAVPVQAGGPRTHRLSAEEMSYFPGQAEAPDPGSFDPSGAVLLSLVDISGFTGAAAPATEVEWTVSRLTAHVADRSAPRGEDNSAAAHPEHNDPELATKLEATPAAGRRHPQAERAEARFFAVFNGGTANGGHPAAGSIDRAAALPDLMAAYASDPDDARTNLWLGLNHLWIAAEGDRTNPRVIESLILAERFLARAERLDPSDRRIPSWLVPARQALARIDGDAAAAATLEADLLAAYAEDPDFHSVSVAMLGFGSPRGSERFVRGLAALRGSDATCADGDPTCENRPRWPHNVEGFLLLAADYELKAGEREAARAIFDKIRTVPSYAAWPYRGEVEDRLAHFDLYAELFADDDPGDDPPTLAIGTRDSCQVCHRAD